MSTCSNQQFPTSTERVPGTLVGLAVAQQTEGPATSVRQLKLKASRGTLARRVRVGSLASDNVGLAPTPRFNTYSSEKWCDNLHVAASEK
eukprot:3575062-Rhodomonas_salina.1